MTAFWLTWMWITRAVMLLAASLCAYWIVSGNTAEAIFTGTCMLGLAANAEFSRRQVT